MQAREEAEHVELRSTKKEKKLQFLQLEKSEN